MTIELNDNDVLLLERKAIEMNVASEAILDLLKSKRISNLSKNKINSLSEKEWKRIRGK